MNIWVLSPQWRLAVLPLTGLVVFSIFTILCWSNILPPSYALVELRPTPYKETPGINVTRVAPTVLYRHSSDNVLNQILEQMIVFNANSSYQPEGRKGLHLAEFVRQTLNLKGLWEIYSRLPPDKLSTAADRGDKAQVRSAINGLQNILFPWISERDTEGNGVEDLFSLVDSYREEAGIVIATGTKGFRWTMHQVSTLRNVLNSTLPIEIFYAGDNDLPPAHRLALESISQNDESGSVRTCDISHFFPDPSNRMGMPGGWALRPFAILASSFRKVILTDADTIFLQDPALLLKEPGFMDKGALFWHDRILGPANPDVYNWLDDLLDEINAKYVPEMKKNSGWFSRSTFYDGALAIDKTTNLPALLMICHLNLKVQRDSITYKRFYGDKESYWVGHALTSTPFHFVPGYSGGIGRISRKGQQNSETIAQMSEEERLSYLESQKDAQEIICTLQLLHLLESNGLPFWFNNGLTEFKGAEDDQFIHAEGWVGHDGKWGGGPTRFPAEMCVEPKESQSDISFGAERSGRSVHRFDEEMTDRINRIIAEAKRSDQIYEEQGLFVIKKAD